MGAFNCCCVDGCCSDACAADIDQIILTLNEGSYGPLVFTRNINAPITRDCYEYLLAGEWCNYITDNKSTAFDCTQLGYLRDCRVTITHTVPVDPLIFSCPLLGGGYWEPGRAKIVTTASGGGTVHEYYWPNDIFTSGIPGGTYRGTFFSFHIGSHWNANWVCNTDAGLAAAIKAELVSALGGTYTEFQSANFSVTVTRDSLSCGSTLGIGNQVAQYNGASCVTGFGGFTPSCYAFQLTKTASVRGAVVEIAPNVLRLRFIRAFRRSMVFGTDCQVPPPSATPRPSDIVVDGVSFVEYTATLTRTSCFTEQTFSVALPTFTVSPGEFDHSCGSIAGGTSVPATALNITGKVEFTYV